MDRSEMRKKALAMANDPDVDLKTRARFAKLAGKMEVTDGLAAALERKRKRQSPSEPNPATKE